ncbi:hypothetical protein OCU04_001007 [Sclerotinia nivalis]|uniref:Uncharacterized protein n=1 Tax=Sclerotinia nivalis TaxID=352851 RepID=A0A9X0DNZ1_9HELO|nr:hypothetical protein OCU04_001007 [Sclerotinia nivalis]
MYRFPEKTVTGNHQISHNPSNPDEMIIPLGPDLSTTARLLPREIAWIQSLCIHALRLISHHHSSKNLSCFLGILDSHSSCPVAIHGPVTPGHLPRSGQPPPLLHVFEFEA